MYFFGDYGVYTLKDIESIPSRLPLGHAFQCKGCLRAFLGRFGTYKIHNHPFKDLCQRKIIVEPNQAIWCCIPTRMHTTHNPTKIIYHTLSSRSANVMRSSIFT